MIVHASDPATVRENSASSESTDEADRQAVVRKYFDQLKLDYTEKMKQKTFSPDDIANAIAAGVPDLDSEPPVGPSTKNATSG